MQNYGWANKLCVVLAGAILLGLAPMAPVRTAVGQDYTYFEGTEADDPESEGGTTGSANAWIGWSDCHATIWAMGEAWAEVLGAQYRADEYWWNAAAQTYFLWWWLEPGTPPGGVLNFSYDCTIEMQQMNEDGYNDWADWATALTNVESEWDVWVEPVESAWKAMSGLGDNGSYTWTGNESEPESSAGWYWYYDAMIDSSWQRVSWSIDIGPEDAPIAEGEDIVYLAMRVNGGLGGRAEVQSQSGGGYAFAYSRTEVGIDANGDASFYRSTGP